MNAARQGNAEPLGVVYQFEFEAIDRVSRGSSYPWYA